MDILTILKANIRYRKGSFFSVLILSFMISLCLTSIISINYNINKRAEEAFKQNDIGDLIPITWDIYCTADVLQKVKENQYTDHIKIVKTITQKLEINKRVLGSSTFFMPYDQKQQSRHIFDSNGLSFQKNPKELKPGEIYVPISFERLYGCSIGNKAYLTNGGSIESFTIKGFFEEPLMGNEMIGIKLALMNEEDFNKLYAGRLMSLEERDTKPGGIRGYDLVHIFFNEDNTIHISEIRRDINQASGIIENSLFTFSKAESKSATLMFTQICSGIMLIFLILLFAIILIVIGHSISTGIEMEYNSLGILKAVGFHKSRLRGVLILEYILPELVGMVLGMVASIPAIYYLNEVFVSMTGLLSSVKPAVVLCFMLLTMVLLVSALFIFRKTRAVNKISPVCAITGGRDSTYFHSRIELAVEGRGLPVRLAFRQLTSNLKQYISSTVIVAILVYFLVAITLLGTSMSKRQTIENIFGMTSSDIFIDFNPQNDKSQKEVAQLKKQVEAEISGTSRIDRSYRISTRYFTVNGDEYHSSIYEDPTMIKSILKGRAPLYDNEIVVTKIMAEELGVKLGESVTVANGDKEEDYIISGYFQITTDMGRAFAMSYEGVKRIMDNFYMDFSLYILSDSDKSAEVVKLLKKNYGKLIDAEDENDGTDFGDTIIESMGILNIIIYSISVLFAFVVILIVCGKAFLKERRDYGIYKALGFTSALLRFQFALRFVMVALIGGLLGVGLNLCLNNIMMSALLRNIGITDFISVYNMVSIFLPITVITLCFFVFAYLVSGKIKRVDTKSLICDN